MLVPRPGMKYMDYPIPLTFSQEDIEKRPQRRAHHEGDLPRRPHEGGAHRGPAGPARSRRSTTPSAMRCAARWTTAASWPSFASAIASPRPEILQTLAVDGTILLPGETRLKAPVLPAVVPFWAVPMFDPILGPKGPAEECFENGSDRDDPLGIGPQRRLGGLNPTDVSVEYSGGRQAPRDDLERRVHLRPALHDPQGRTLPRRRPVAAVDRRARRHHRAPAGCANGAMPMADIAREKANEFVGRSRPSIYIGKIGTSFYLGTSKPIAIGQVEGVRVDRRAGRAGATHGLSDALPAHCHQAHRSHAVRGSPATSSPSRSATPTPARRRSSDLVVSDILERPARVHPRVRRDRPAGHLHIGRERGRFGCGPLGPARRSASGAVGQRAVQGEGAVKVDTASVWCRVPGNPSQHLRKILSFQGDPDRVPNRGVFPSSRCYGFAWLQACVETYKPEPRAKELSMSLPGIPRI